MRIYITSYETDRKGNAVNDTAVEHVSVKAALEAKRKQSDLVMFARVDAEGHDALVEGLDRAEKGRWALYETKAEERDGLKSYVLGFAKGSGGPKTECKLDV